MDHGADIYHAAAACRERFDACLADPVLEEFMITIRSAQGDFNLWCSAINATSQGKASLDYRLRNHHDVRNTVCELLAALTVSLKRLATSAAAANTNVERHVYSVIDPIRETPDSPTSTDSHASWDVISDGWSNADSDEDQEVPAADPITRECMFYVKTTLDQLARLSLAIRKGGNKFRYGKIDAQLNRETYEAFSHHLASVILRSFPDPEARELSAEEKMNRVTNYEALTPVQKRLVHANVLRRHRIEFVTSSKKKGKRPADQGIGLVKDSRGLGETHVSGTSFVPGTQTSRQTHSPMPSQKAQSGSSRDIQVPSVLLQSAPTATDLDSRVDVRRFLKAPTSSDVTNVNKIRTAQSYPDLPKESSEDMWLCPYCDDVLPSSYTKGAESWRSHVAQDLMPYCCFVDGCETPYEMYLTSENLIAHVLEKHSKSCWTCNVCEPRYHTSKSLPYYTTLDFWSAEDWAEHVTTAHSDRIRAAHLSVLAELSKRSVLPPLACPLCDFATSTTASRVDDHILHHLHEFSLRALPEISHDDRSRVSQVPGSLSHVEEEKNKEAQYPIEYPVVEQSQWLPNLNELRSLYSSPSLGPVIDRVSGYLDRNSLDSAAAEFWGFRMTKVASVLETIHSAADRPSEMVMTEEMMEDIIEQTSADILNSLDPSESKFYQDISQDERGKRFAIPEAPNLDLSAKQQGLKNSVYDHLFEQKSFIHLKSRSQPEQQPRVLLTGSGVGSTLIAGVLARQIFNIYGCSVFWVNATSLSSISHAYSQILDLVYREYKGSDTERFLVYYFNWLLRREWFMVFDGIDGQTLLSLQFKGWLPSGIRGRLLLTSKDPSCVNLLGQGTEILIPPHEDTYSDLHALPGLRSSRSSHSESPKPSSGSHSELHPVPGPDASRNSRGGSHAVPRSSSRISSSRRRTGFMSSTSVVLRWICVRNQRDRF